MPGSRFDLTVLDPSDRKGTDTYVSLLLMIKRWDLYLRNRKMDLVYIMSSFLLHYSVFHELNILDACWIEVDAWSNSSRCREESVY